MNPLLLGGALGAYALATAAVGWLGWRRARSAADYLAGTRADHPFLTALAYAGTFVTVASVVGFGGMASVHGLALLWLPALDVLLGVFVALAVIGPAARRLGAELDARTLPELLGRRFGSPFLQGFGALLVGAVAVLYAAAILVGGARFLEVELHAAYHPVLLAFGLLAAAYVWWGGARGVLHSEALQGALLLAGVLALAAVTWSLVGGAGATAALRGAAASVPPELAAQGHRGWTAMPAAGSPLWWQLLSSLVLGVGLGALAQPALLARVQTLRDRRELARGLVPGGLFVAVLTAGAFLAGAHANLFFLARRGQAAVQAAADPLTGAWNADRVIPLLVHDAFPEALGYLFLLVLLGAALAALASQLQAAGIAVARDLVQEALGHGRYPRWTGAVARAVAVLGALAALAVAWRLPVSSVATTAALSFGLCAAAFLSPLVAGLFWRRATRAGAVAGMAAGAGAWALWALLIHRPESAALGLARLLSGRESLAAGTAWALVDPVAVAFPLSAILTCAVSLATRAGPRNGASDIA